MNPYQRIPGKQKGRIDTAKKFEQMVAGIELKGLRVLDVGCNLGEMSRLMAAAGASVRGVDRVVDFVLDARKLTEGSNPTFSVQDGYQVRGVWDLVILSASFHYFQDPRRLLRRLARVTKRVRMDVWTHHEHDGMKLSHRGILIPSAGLFEELAILEGWTAMNLGPVVSPDDSERYLFELRRSGMVPAASVLIYGPGSTGKTTRGKRLAVGGFEHLQLDQVFSGWKRRHDRHGWSVRAQTSEIRESPRWQEYLDHARMFVGRWLRSRKACDVVIEGFGAIDPEYREVVREELARNGWDAVDEIETRREP